MKSLVVPVDGSDNSINAAHYAADMALAIDADLHLLHVVKIQSLPGEAPVGFIFDDMQKAGKVLLDKLSNDLTDRTHGQISISTLLEAGSAESRILEVSRRIQPFAVIMGAPEGSFSRALSGSPVLDASRHLPYPVLVIPTGAVFRRIRNIVLAGDVKAIAGEMPITAAFLKELRTLFDSRFDILHIVSENERKEGLKALGLYHWKQALGDVDATLHFVKSPALLEGVQEYLFEHQGDWLMLFPAKHGLFSFHRSHSKPLILHCTVPVMSICEAALAELAAPAKASQADQP